MKVFLSVSLLLVGIIATCTAKSIELSFNLQQGSDSSEESAETKEAILQLQKACYEQTGSNLTFEALIESFTAVPICVLVEINAVGFVYDLERLNANTSTRHEFFPKYCPQIRNALPCLDPPVKAFSECLDVDDGLILYAMYNTTPKVLDLICENDGEFLFQDGDSLDDCIKNYSKYSDVCANLVSDSTNVMAVSKYGQDECRELSQVRTCVQSKLTECRGLRLMVIFDLYWDALMENSPCRNFVSSEPDQTS